MKVNVSILTVSDTRSLADDFSGQLIFELLTKKFQSIPTYYR